MIYPKITLELPKGDDRIINQWWIDSKDGGYHVCISVDDPINTMQNESFHCKPDTKRGFFDDSEYFPNASPEIEPDSQEYIPEMWSIKKDLVYKLIPCLETGLENTQAALIEHDSSLGRTTTKNKMWAETLEQEIRDMKDCIKELKAIDVSNSTHYP